MTENEPKSTPWVVRDCGNPKHGPDWHCHSVRDSTGERILDSVTREQAEHFASIPDLREQVRTLTAERDNLQTHLREANDTKADVMDACDALRARVAELESERDVERAMRLERETLLAGAREREEIAQAAVAQAVRERDTARDAALEEAKQELTRLDVRGVPWMFSGILALLDRLKAQPARRFVEAEKAETERRDAWIHGIETAAGIVAERGDDVQAASVVYDVLKARVAFERSHGTEVKP